MIFRQLFEPESSTYTYLVGCRETGDAVLIDPVMETVERDLAEIQRLGLRLAYTLETHIHADHVTSACRLRTLTGCQVACPAMEDLPCADIGIAEDRPLAVGGIVFRALHTPGHTDTHHCYVVGREDISRVFTGDALLIDGCGRTDFQNGDPDDLFRSVREKLFTLPDDTLVYPGHDYQHRHVTTILQERERNPRLGDDKSRDDFREIMANLDLPYPKKINAAVPANRRCGDCRDQVPEAHRLSDEKFVQGVPS
ncbi:Hydroxyacylglutathione hydrolase [Caenispirillum salinarum AK4]|uniref:Hydroxyacylglutathione hydrolase n=1 Tax=Caenispirillum salinarum AK4 TaxID=1238182 RepID=K9HEG2_9PROT|nr:MBL fold metallo-hydrolase [Caenispirillum salinarum]EKV28888.1 Hydroxyacylglutathione hydrolase [Caenispirillum salinarum AK4]